MLSNDSMVRSIATARISFDPLSLWSGSGWQLDSNRAGENLLRIDRAGGHPASEQACIRRRTAPADGIVSIAGTLIPPFTARVRHVIMRGDWPEKLPPRQLDNLVAVSAPDRSKGDRRVLGAIFDDRHIPGSN